MPAKINLFLHVMIGAIVESGGFIDKFVGDKVMALFTAPLSETAAAMGCSGGSVKTHCARAVRALAEMLAVKGVKL